MSKILIIFAQTSEAKVTLQRTNATAMAGATARIWSEGEVPSCYRYEKGWIVISSIGLHAAQMAVSKYAHLCDEIWNLGIAGALKNHRQLGELCPIEMVDKYIPLVNTPLDPRSQECVHFSLPSLSLESGGMKLISSDFPIHENAHRTYLQTRWDLVDMEGYGIAFASHHIGKKCRMWKIVSDFASPGGRELIQKTKAQASEQIADMIMERLKSV